MAENKNKDNDQGPPNEGKAAKKKKTAPKSAPDKGEKTVRDTIQESIRAKMQEESYEESRPRKRTDFVEDYHPRKPRFNFVSSAKGNIRTVNFFLRQMSFLLTAGIALTRALTILANRVKDRKFRMTLMDIIDDVEKGMPFWEALGQHPGYFNQMIVNVIRTGEESGNIVESLEYLSNYRDREEDIVRSVQKAITYPLFLLVLAMGVVLVLITTVIPMFAEVFRDSNVELPWPTRLVFGLSGTLNNVWLKLFLVAVLIYLIWKLVNRNESLRATWDRIKLRIPVFGDILVNIYSSQIATMMSLLLSSGVPILKTIDLVKATIDNMVINDAFVYVRQHVERGRSLSGALSEVGVFPDYFMDMIAVGEETGSLPGVLDQVATIYQKEVDHDTAIIGTLLEPVLIIGLGLVVGFIALSTFLPYVNMLSIIAR